MAKPKVLSVDKVEVREHDGPMLLPEGLTAEKAIEVLQRKIRYEQQTFEVDAQFEGFIWESAYALSKVLEEKYGWAGAQTKVVETFFGPLHIPPKMIGIKIGPDETVQIPWGQFAVPGIAGYLESGAEKVQPGKWVFKLGGEVKRKDEKKVNEIVEGIRKFVRERSIYRNKAFRLRLYDDNGKPMQFPDITFERINDTLERELVLPTTTDRMVRVNLFTPIERTEEVRAHGVPLKRGVLLAGQFGTGKTMIANVTATKAQRHGWTYIVCEKAQELSEVIRVARMYQPCVVFCEDIDRITGGERDENIDHILNVIDGVESKNTEILVVLTTNEIDNIHPALLRPGRMDVIITVQPPDAEAAQRLARMYSRGLIHEDEVLERSGPMMAGQIPAVIREIVERSKLGAVESTPPGEPFRISDDDLVIATIEMREHIQRAMPKPDDNRSDREKAADRLGQWLYRAVRASQQERGEIALAEVSLPALAAGIGVTSGPGEGVDNAELDGEFERHGVDLG